MKLAHGDGQESIVEQRLVGNLIQECDGIWTWHHAPSVTKCCRVLACILSVIILQVTVKSYSMFVTCHA